MSDGAGLWIGFSALVVALLALDLGVLNRRAHTLSLRQAAAWSGSLVAIALGSGALLVPLRGTTVALEFVTAYVIELSLSVDNLFVFILVFEYFAVPPALQPRALKWGVFGAMVLRGVMIAAGVLLLQRLEFLIYLFGALLLCTGWKMFREAEMRVDPEHNPLLRLARRLLPFVERYDEQRFFTRAEGRFAATPLLLVVLVIEWCDLVFAVDSIPAIFAVTRDPFVIYSSNVLAVLGLRALYFVLAGIMLRFRYLRPGVALILVFVGAKMLAEHWLHVPVALSLALVLGTLAGSMLLSLLRR